MYSLPLVCIHLGFTPCVRSITACIGFGGTLIRGDGKIVVGGGIPSIGGSCPAALVSARRVAVPTSSAGELLVGLASVKGSIFVRCGVDYELRRPSFVRDSRAGA